MPDALAPAPDPSGARAARHTGGCQCGAVRFAIYAAPIRVGLCHCRMCQKASGAPFVTLAEIALSEFNWTRGAPAHFASSSRAVREFCRACGTPLAYRQPAGSSIELMCGTFDRPGDITPTYQVGIESQLSWVAHIAALPGRTSGAAMAGTAADRLVSHQHPDHDTSAA